MSERTASGELAVADELTLLSSFLPGFLEASLLLASESLICMLGNMRVASLI